MEGLVKHCFPNGHSRYSFIFMDKIRSQLLPHWTLWNNFYFLFRLHYHLPSNQQWKLCRIKIKLFWGNIHFKFPSNAISNFCNYENKVKHDLYSYLVTKYIEHITPWKAKNSDMAPNKKVIKILDWNIIIHSRLYK